MSRERDELLRVALTSDEPPVPAGLADAIADAVLRTRQRPAGAAGWWPRPISARLVWVALLVTLMLIGVLAAAATILVPAPPSVPMFRGVPERTGRMVGPGPVGAPTLTWDAQLGGAVPSTVAPAAARGRVFIADDGGTLSAFELASGEPVWSTGLGSRVRSSPAVLGDLVVTGTDDGLVVALRIDDGSIAWTFQTGGPIVGSLAVIDELVLVPGADGRLVALDGQGTLRWFVDVGAPLDRGPAIAGHVIVQPYRDGGLVGVDRGTRRERWRVELGPGSVMTPMVSEGVVYVSAGVGSQATERFMVALSITDGSERWRYRTESQVYPNAIAGHVVLAATDAGEAFGFGPDGTVLWSDPSSGILPVGMAVVGDLAYGAGADRMIRASDPATGAEVWSVPVTGTPSSPIVIDGWLIAGTSFGSLEVFTDR
jgi:outer membrane protein assembly factor BamB